MSVVGTPLFHRTGNIPPVDVRYHPTAAPESFTPAAAELIVPAGTGNWVTAPFWNNKATELLSGANASPAAIPLELIPSAPTLSQVPGGTPRSVRVPFW